MAGAVTGIRKSALCRYFLANGSCFYGDDCQFMHDVPTSHGPGGPSSPPRQQFPPGPLKHRGPSGEMDGGNGDQFFSATFNPTSNGINEYPQSSYNQQQQRRSVGRPISSRSTLGLSQNAKPFVPNTGMELNQKFGAMNFDGMGSQVNPGAMEFIPKSSGSLTHSSSTPALTNYGDYPPLTAPLSLTTELISQVGSSPAHSPGQSPLMARRNKSPIPQLTANNMSGAFQQEYVGGTTYFYSHGENHTPPAKMVFPNYTMYASVPPHIAHMKIRPNMPSFFMPDELKMELLNKHAVTLAMPEDTSSIPAEVDTYHHLCPLETIPPNVMQKSNTFGFPTTCYKAVNTKDGLTYCLRRIIGFRMTSSKCMAVIDLWKKILHSNIVTLREVFTTKAFGDHSMVFVYDFFTQAETLMSTHFSNPVPHSGYSSPYNLDGQARPFSAGKGANGPRQNSGLLPESLIWSYVVQLSSALRTIHASGLACRVMDPTKVLVTEKTRLRLNCVGIFDVLSFDANQTNPLALMPHYQQEDLISLGKVVLALACNSVIGIQREHIQTSMDLVARNYSADLKNLILYLLTNQNRLRSVNDIMPMIGARFYTQLDAAQLRNDVLENELSKEVEAGRLFRLLAKLGVINDRPEFNLDPAWSETGDRYMLKLYRDYLFHQVDESGAPWIDMAHTIQSLNKLDAGTSEKVCLMSRDEQSVIVVTYGELKRCFEAAFSEVLQKSQDSGLS